MRRETATTSRRRTTHYVQPTFCVPLRASYCFIEIGYTAMELSDDHVTRHLARLGRHCREERLQPLRGHRLVLMP